MADILLRVNSYINSNKVLSKKLDKVIHTISSHVRGVGHQIQPYLFRRPRRSHLIVYTVVFFVVLLLYNSKSTTIGGNNLPASSLDGHLENPNDLDLPSRKSVEDPVSQTKQSPLNPQLSASNINDRPEVTRSHQSLNRPGTGHNAVRRKGPNRRSVSNDVIQDGGGSGANLINPHNYHIMINSPRLCKDGNKVTLLIAVSSATLHSSARKAIRSTWGSQHVLAPLGVRLVFMLARPLQDHKNKLQQQIVEESRTYGDIIQEDFVDSYLNLTLKSVMALKWADQHCSDLRYFMKADDDIFINVPRLLAFLDEQRQTSPSFITGCIKQHKAFAPVNAPAHMPLPPAHPLFVAGAGYVLTGDLVPSLYRASLTTRMVPVEDVFVTGHLAKTVGAHPPLHHPAFTCGELLMDDCDAMQMFTGHKITPERMRQIWEKVNPQDYSASPCFDF